MQHPPTTSVGFHLFLLVPYETTNPDKGSHSTRCGGKAWWRSRALPPQGPASPTPTQRHVWLVWRSRFPGLLHKSVWYALDLASFTAQVCSVMWGVGYRGYPRGGWVGILHRFRRIQRLDHVQPLPMLYRNEG